MTPFLAEVSWRAPALPNGVITHYTVYAVPQISHEETRSKRQTPSTSPRTIKKVIPTRLALAYYININLLGYYRHFQAPTLLVISVLRNTLLPTSFKLVLQSILAKLPMRGISLLYHQMQLSLCRGQVYDIIGS